mmetsp:Transcript_27542/g.65250  ORF Transcript_27542/g.65250 Transcript_27542/m.65250 type:complete len:359 (+) Transcript_27542:82-1158(+)
MIFSENLLGVAAGLASCVSFGSFGVPIKDPKVIAAKVDPVVFQCYKTTACFLSSFLVLAYVDFKFTWWGVLGAFIWVFNGIFAIMAVQMAGLSVSQSLWSGLSIFVSFIWGAYIFNEPIRDFNISFAGLSLMALGMFGVGHASASQAQPPAAPKPLSPVSTGESIPMIRDEDGQSSSQATHTPSSAPIDGADSGNRKYAPRKGNRRLTGLLCAVYVGFANGSFMVPFKKIPKTVKGIEYLPSFGIGAMAVTIPIVSAYFAFTKFVRKRPVPNFEWEVAHRPAFLTGILWSLGNYFSIYTTEFLGMAVGWPLVQCQLLVSTLWGIIYFRELTDTYSVTVFMISSCAVLTGVIMLGLFGL